MSPEAAVSANAARSMLLDYDDYLFAGHTGHSAVLVTLALSELLGSSGADLLAATVAANEAGGRLGAAMLLGPHNGQMWAYIHDLAGAFMGSDDKALTASPAAEGLECYVDILADPSGFFARVQPQAMTGMLSGYGQAWLTDSLTDKVHAGCAYLDTPVDAALALREINMAFSAACSRRNGSGPDLFDDLERLASLPGAAAVTSRAAR